MRNSKGSILVITTGFALIFTMLGIASIYISTLQSEIQEKRIFSQKAFWLAEAGIQKVIWALRNKPSLNQTDWNNFISQVNDNSNLGDGGFSVTGDYLTKNIISTGTVNEVTRKIQVQAQTSWLNKIPAAVYVRNIGNITFQKRDDAYIDGTTMPGMYSIGDIRTNRIGEGRIEGTPPILENQLVPDNLQDGIWNAFDFNALRDYAKANGTYFSAEGNDEFNNSYNKSGKYTLPVKEGQTSGVFFFDARNGEPLDDDGVNPKNEIRVKLRGTTEQMSGVLVVVGDLKIIDTDVYDFLFNGVILVLDDLKISDKTHHRRLGTNDSDILINGAVLNDNIVLRNRERKKKATVIINNATIKYDPGSINYWDTVGNWKEI